MQSEKYKLSKRLVIIPTFNEAENIQLIIDAVMNLEVEFDILVVDDGSPDGTAQLVKQSAEKFGNRVQLLERTNKSGLGRAYIVGFHWAIDRGYDYIFEMDADFSHNPQQLVSLYEKAISGYDVIVGSRYVKGGKIENWPFDRRFLSYGASLYAKLITGMPIQDSTAGFVCYNRETLESIDLSKISSIGYSFQIEMKYAAWKLGKKLVEVPIVFKDRERGESKMDSSIIKEAALGVLQMRRHSKDYYRK